MSVQSKGSHIKTTSTLSSTKSNVFVSQLRSQLFELFLKLSQSRFPGQKYLFPGLEIIFFLNIIVSSVSPLMDINDTTKIISSILFIFQEPTRLSFFSYEALIVVFIASIVCILLGLFLLAVLLLTTQTNDMWYTVYSIYSRVLRTFLVFPMIHIFLETTNCDFRGGMDMSNYAGQSCVTFPNLLFFIMSIVFLLILFILISIDSLFLMDMYRNISLITAKVNGRFYVFVMCMYFVNKFLQREGIQLILLDNGDVWRAVGLLLLLLRYVFIVGLFIYSLRFSSYLGVFFNYICTGTFCLCSLVETMTIIISTTGEWGMISGLCLFLFPIFLLLYTIKYWIIYSKYKFEIKNNFFIAYYPEDLAQIIYFTKKFRKRERSKKMMSELIKNPKFVKSKKLCQLMIPIILHIWEDTRLANSFLLHTRGMTKRVFWDVDFGLYFYHDLVSELQTKSKDTETHHIQKEINRLRKKEYELERKYIGFCEVLKDLHGDHENKALNRVNMFIHDIQNTTYYCESMYRKIIKLCPSEYTYKKYSNFLRRFHNDKHMADIYIEEAEHLRIEKTSSGNESDFRVMSQDSIGPSISEINPTNRSSITRPRKTRNIATSSTMTNKRLREVMNIHTGGSISHASKRKTSRKDAEMVKLRKRVMNQKYFPAILFDIGIVISGIISIALTVLVAFFIISLSLQFQSIVLDVGTPANYVRTNLLLGSVSIQRNRFAKNPKYSNNYPYKYEEYSNSSKVSCVAALENMEILYAALSRKRRIPLEEHFSEVVTYYDKETDLELSRNVSYLDVIFLAVEKCLALFSPSSSSASTSDKNENYMWINKNILEVHKVIAFALNVWVESEKNFTIYCYIPLFVIPGALLFMGLYFLVTFLCFHFQQLKNIQGLKLIPQRNIELLRKRFDRDGTANDANNSESRIDLGRFSLMGRFFTVLAIFILFFGIFLLFFAIMAFVISIQHYPAINTLNIATRLIEHVQLVQYFTDEMLHSEESFHKMEEILEVIEERSEKLHEQFDILRFQTAERQYFESYYEDDCPTELSSNMTTCQKMACHSVNTQVFALIENVIYLRDSFLDGIDPQFLLQSEQYHILQCIAADLDVREYTDGTLNPKLFDAIFMFIEYVGELLLITINIMVVLFILLLPVFSLGLVVTFLTFRRALHRNMNYPRELMLLLHSKLLFSKDIFSFLTSTNLFSKMKKDNSSITKWQNNQSDFFKLVDNSTYSVICFDNKLRGLYANHSARALLGFQGMGFDLSDFLKPESVNEVNFWIDSKQEMQSFRSECLCEVNDRTFSILVDIAKNKKSDSFVCIVEDVLTTKKEKIVEEVERISQKTDLLLKNMFPHSIAVKVEDIGKCMIQKNKSVTAVFVDWVGFQEFAKNMSAERMIFFLHSFFCALDELATENGIEKIKSIADTYFCVSGLPIHKPFHAHIAMKFCLQVLKYLQKFNTENAKSFDNYMGIEVRVGMSSGKVISGLIGKEKWTYDAWGSVINMASRMEKFCKKNCIQVSKSTFLLLNEKYEFEKKILNVQGIGVMEEAYLYDPHKIELENKERVVKEAVREELIEIKEDGEEEEEEMKPLGEDERDESIQMEDLINGVNDILGEERSSIKKKKKKKKKKKSKTNYPKF